jgi:chitin synthase
MNKKFRKCLKRDLKITSIAKEKNPKKTLHILSICIMEVQNKSPYKWIVENGKDRDKNERNFDAKDITFFFCAKHDNSGKIESHMWFYKGFCANTNPQYCQMIDAGTIPLHNSISKIIRYLDKYRDVGGASGEIETFEPTNRELGYGYFLITDPEQVRKLTNDPNDDLKKDIRSKKYQNIKGDWYEVKRRSCLQKFEAKLLILAQYVEYKISHYLDKSFESLFGFVSVLPGAFCTFRWEAINGDPLKSFFKGLEKDKHTAKEANMYLAEDRVMCLEILCKYSEAWLLRYIPGCIALTDPPNSVIDLIKQRRRWTNGSLFASWYVIDHLNMISRSGHSCCRKTGLSVLYFYMLLNFIFTLVLVGSLYATFSIFIRSFFKQEECKSISGARIFEIAYLALLFVFALMAITKPISRSNSIYTIYVIIFGIFIFVSIGFSIIYFWENTTNIFVGILILSALIGSYIVPPMLNCHRINF